MTAQLREKIEKLFAYRKFDLIYQMTGESTEVIHDFNDKLIQLQASIYHLDAYLEGNFSIEQNQLDHYWKLIHDQLVNCGVDRSDVDDYSRHIYRYQSHELGIRENKSPLRFKLEYFYFYKSCDVKLLRRLLMDRFDALRSVWTEADWRYFDLVTEVNDDVEDIYEDQETINGNLFALMIERDGLDTAEQMFGDFLDYVSIQSKERFEGKGEMGQLIDSWTQSEVYDTMQLLTDRVGDEDLAKIRMPKGQR